MIPLSSMELIILHGPQSGAHIQFKDKDSWLIGGDLNSDIVLRDPLISGQQIKLLLAGEAITLHVISGEVELSNKVLSAGEQTVLTAYTPVKIGETVFAYGELESDLWKSVPRNIHDEDIHAEEEEVRQVTSGMMSKYSNSANAKFAVPGLMLFFILSAALVFFQPQEIKVTVDDELNRLSEFLQGYLTSKAENAQLENLISDLDLVIVNNTEVGEELTAQVKDVYRLNNIEAEVHLLRQGVVKVTTAENNLELLKKVEQIVNRDVPLLSQLETENHPKDVIADGSEKVKNDPGKIVTMIVPGDPAYLVTSDQSRYFVGAMLPTGHKISDIAQGKVFLDKAGVETMLQF